MYYIVGADNQPRGPVDAATLNQWITEGRADGLTRTRKEEGGSWIPLAHFPEFAPALTGVAAPVASNYAGTAPPLVAKNSGDGTDGIIPLQNKHAMIGFFMALGGLILGCLPFLGIPYAGVTVWMGIKGLQNVKENPMIRGTAQAWIAISLGAFEVLCGIGTTIWFTNMLI